MKTIIKVNSIFKNDNKQMILIENQQYKDLKLDTSKEYVMELKEAKSKRSLQQNRLLWKNLQLASKKLGQDLMDTYCNLLEEADAKSDFVITPFEMDEALRKSFRGVRFIRTQEVNGKQCFVYKIYLGSSKMNVQEMNELIDRSFDLLSKLDINYEDDLDWIEFSNSKLKE